MVNILAYEGPTLAMMLRIMDIGLVFLCITYQLDRSNRQEHICFTPKYVVSGIRKYIKLKVFVKSVNNTLKGI